MLSYHSVSRWFSAAAFSLTVTSPALAQVDEGVKFDPQPGAAQDCVIEDSFYGNGDILGSYVPPFKGDRAQLQMSPDTFQKRIDLARINPPNGQPYADLGGVKWRRQATGSFEAVQKRRGGNGLLPQAMLLELNFTRDSGQKPVTRVKFARSTYGSSGIATHIGQLQDGRIVEKFATEFQGKTELMFRCEPLGKN